MAPTPPVCLGLACRRVGQSCTHQELLRGIQNGAALVACDLTSPDATTLVRQYQSAVFTPIMRVHMMQVKKTDLTFIYLCWAATEFQFRPRVNSAYIWVVALSGRRVRIPGLMHQTDQP